MPGSISAAGSAEIQSALNGVKSKSVLSRLSDFFIILGFTIYLGGGVQFLIMLRGAEGFSTLEGDLPSQLIYLSVYAVTFLFLILTSKKISPGIIKNFWLWLLLFWTFLSFFWSYSPEVTIRQVIALFGTTFFSVYLVNTYDVEEYVKLLAISLLIINISSYLVVVFLPDIGISHIVTDEWRGIFTHKNHLGKAASLSTLIFFYLLLTVKRRKWIWLIGLLSSAGLLVGGQSAAAIIISLFILIVTMFFFLVKKLPILGGITFLGLIVFITVIPLPSIEEFLGYFGKEGTLTGRTPLWEFCMFMAQKKPLLGYGYGAFWLGSEGPSAEIWRAVNMGADSNHCHNGFLDVVLAVGGIGLTLLFIVYCIAIIRSSHFLFRRRLGFQYSIYLILLIWILTYNITEQGLLYRNNISWVLISSVVLYLSATNRGIATQSYSK